MIGFYDSGLGGLTILKEMVEISPATALVYYGDTASCPLGEKTPEQIHAAVTKGVEFLLDQGCSLVVLACNTATVTSVRRLQGKWLKRYPGRNVLGVVRPVSEELVEREVSPQETIAVLATSATIETNFYQEELREAGYQNLVDVPCPGLALAIEARDETRQRELLRSYFAKLDVASIRHLVLACTHYPIIREIIREEFVAAGGSSEVEIICQSEIVPEKLIDYLIRHPEYELKGQGVEIFVNEDPEAFEQKVADLFDIRTKVTLAEPVPVG